MKLISTICLLFLSLSIYAQQTVEGLWNTGKTNTKIEIKNSLDLFIGTIVSSDNPDAQIGKQILKDIEYVDGIWKAKLYAAKKGKWIDAELLPEKEILKVKVNAGIRKKTIKWNKAEA